MGSTTLLAAIEDVARRLDAWEEGTLTARASDGTTVTCGSFPFKTGRANASNAAYDGCELLITSGTTPVINPNGVASYVASTGVFTMASAYTTNPDATATFALIKRGLTRDLLVSSINRALRGMYYLTVLPITLVTDGDMQTSGVGSWTASNATLSKVVSAGNVYRGGQSLRVLATAANGQARSVSLNVDPTYQDDFYIQAAVRADVGTATLIAYDATNSANIDTATWTSRGWGTIGFDFTIPATCELLSIRLESTANSDDTYWGAVQLIRRGARDMPLPASITERGQLRRVLYGITGRDEADTEFPMTSLWERMVPDQNSPLNSWRLLFPSAVPYALWVEAAIPYASLSADTDTTMADRLWLEQKALVATLDFLAAKSPASEATHWTTRLRQEERTLRYMDGGMQPKPLLYPKYFDAPNVPRSL